MELKWKERKWEEKNEKKDTSLRHFHDRGLTEHEKKRRVFFRKDRILNIVKIVKIMMETQALGN